MAERESIRLWSTTSTSNGTIDPSVNFAEGQLPSTVNNSMRAVMSAAARYLKDVDGLLVTSGTSSAYTLTINQTWSALGLDQWLSFKAHASNTVSTATLNVTNADASALGAKAIRAPGDIALLPGQIVNGGRYITQYDSAANAAAGAWMLLNPAALPRLFETPFTASGTFTTSSLSTTTTVYKVRAIGGAGGGGGSANAAAAAGGGGAGAYVEHTFSGIAASTGITITIGAGGVGGTGAGTNGSAGGSTSIGSPISITAGGGQGGSGQTAAAGTTGGSGGTVTGTANIASLQGANGFTGATNTNPIGGQGAGSPFGVGGAGGVGGVSGPGVTALAYGAGGGGGIGSGSAGGSGGGGFMAIISVL